ncbi:YcaO-like family protein [Rhizobium tibeticum]|uniref:YcaO-like family protein n=1 Tax=Rhizobium tibeticum TaxID=501024 RepID=UPI001428A10E|nr:YcaO-like family protein [Rhizobium tibeticum]
MKYIAEVLGPSFSVKTLRMPGDLAAYHNLLIQGHNRLRSPVNASGFSTERNLAVLKALGEFIERYSLLCPPAPQMLRRGTRHDLPGQALDMAAMPLFSENQCARKDFPWTGFTDSTYDWIEAYNLIDNTPVYVPVDLLLLHKPSHISLMGSTGAAAHRNETQALISAILELVERDALSIIWETQAITPCIPNSASYLLKETLQTIKQLGKANQDVILRDMTTDLGIPVAACVILDRARRRPCLALGAGAALSHSEACQKALDEATAVWLWMRDEHKKSATIFENILPLACNAVEPMWQAVLYGFQEMLPAAYILTEPTLPPKEVSEAEPGLSHSQYLERLKGSLAKNRISLYYRSILPQEFKELGWVAIRAIAPSLVPLAFGNQCRPLGHPRLLTVPKTRNWAESPRKANVHHAPIPLP